MLKCSFSPEIKGRASFFTYMPLAMSSQWIVMALRHVQINWCVELTGYHTHKLCPPPVCVEICVPWSWKEICTKLSLQRISSYGFDLGRFDACELWKLRAILHIIKWTVPSADLYKGEDLRKNGKGSVETFVYLIWITVGTCDLPRTSGHQNVFCDLVVSWPLTLESLVQYNANPF